MPLQQRFPQVQHDLPADGRHDQPVRHDPPALAPLGREEGGHGAGVVQPQWLGARQREVIGQPGQVAQGPGRIGALHPVRVLLERDPPVPGRLGEQRHHALPVSVRGAQVTRALPGIHPLTIAALTPGRHNPYPDRTGPALTGRGQPDRSVLRARC